MNKIFAQNRYWGSLEEAIDLWKNNLGVEGMMIKQTNDLTLIKPNGRIDYESFDKLGRLQKEYGISFNLHPYDHQIFADKDKIYLDFLGPAEAEHYARLIGEMDKQIHKNELDPLITLHLGAIEIPGYMRARTTKRALDASIYFAGLLNKQKIESEIAFENMPDPGKNGEIHLIGNKYEHLKKVLEAGDEIDAGLCIDTGHDTLSEESITDEYLEKREYELKTIHFNGTNGEWDSHHIPSKDTVRGFEKSKNLVKEAKRVVLEIKNYDYDIETLQDFVDKVKRIC